MVAFRYSDRPQLWDRTGDLSGRVWPEYNLHGDILNAYWNRLYDTFADYQFVLYDETTDEVLAEGHTIPCYWDQTPGDLNSGIDATIAAGFDAKAKGAPVNTLAALAAEIVPEHTRRGLSSQLLTKMVDLARGAGLSSLIAPVRPSWKERYPLVPIARYVSWLGADGQPFDPWIRTHVRLGGKIATPLPESLRITGTVADWESWTKLAYPESGDYVFPHGLATVRIDRDLDLGAYWEPNVWIIHNAIPAATHD